MIRLGILGSTRGTNLIAIHDAIKAKQLDASIAIVASNKADAFILERANSFGLKSACIPSQGKVREDFDRDMSSLLKSNNVDLIVLIGYMRILSQPFVTEWHNKIINVHPSLLPDFAGLMDLSVHQAVLDAKKLETGCTVHFVTEEVDGGPIILQKRCAVLSDDTAETLKQRVQALEGCALIEAIQQIKQQFS